MALGLVHPAGDAHEDLSSLPLLWPKVAFGVGHQASQVERHIPRSGEILKAHDAFRIGVGSEFWTVVSADSDSRVSHTLHVAGWVCSDSRRTTRSWGSAVIRAKSNA
jgi:hypothetical protein